MLLLLDSLENGDGKGSFSLHLIVFVHDITYVPSPSPLSAGNFAIERSEMDDRRIPLLSFFLAHRIFCLEGYSL